MNPFAKYSSEATRLRASTSSFGRSFALRVALGAAAAGAVVLGATSDAAAQEVVVGVAPPVPRVEIIPRAPSPHHFWVGGYWGYRPSYGYVWNRGYWESPRVGWGWAPAHWSAYGGRWHFAGGHWHHR
jgi:hypothetical protein